MNTLHINYLQSIKDWENLLAKINTLILANPPINDLILAYQPSKNIIDKQINILEQMKKLAIQNSLSNEILKINKIQSNTLKQYKLMSNLIENYKHISTL